MTNKTTAEEAFEKTGQAIDKVEDELVAIGIKSAIMEYRKALLNQNKDRLNEIAKEVEEYFDNEIHEHEIGNKSGVNALKNAKTDLSLIITKHTE